MTSVEEQQLPPPVPHKNVPRRDSPTIQSILTQKPNSHLSYSKYILLTDSLDLDDDYDDIAAFLNEGSIDLRTSLFGKPASATSASSGTSASTSAQVATIVPVPISTPAVLEAKPVPSSTPVVPKQEGGEQKRTGPGRPRGSATRKNYEEDDDDMAAGGAKRKHSPPNSAPQKRQHRDKDLDDNEDDDDPDGDDNSAAHGASGGADDTDEIEFKPRASSTRGAAKREVRSSGTLTRTSSANNTAATGNAPTGRKVGRPPNSANSSTSSLPLPAAGGSSTSVAGATATSPQTRRGPGRPPKRQVPLTMPDGSIASSSASNLNDAEEVEIKLGAPVSPLSSQGSQSVLGGESSQDSSQPNKSGVSKTSSSGSVPTKAPKRRGRPRKQYVADGEEEEEDADASEQADERSHQTVTVSNPADFDSTLEYHLKNRPTKDTAVFVYLFGNRDARKGESWCPECAQSDPIIKATLAQRPRWILIECPVGERSEFKNKPEHPYRLHRKIQLKAIPTLIKWGNERPRAQLVEYECHQPKTLEEFILKDKETH